MLTETKRESLYSEREKQEFWVISQKFFSSNACRWGLGLTIKFLRPEIGEMKLLGDDKNFFCSNTCMWGLGLAFNFLHPEVGEMKLLGDDRIFFGSNACRLGLGMIFDWAALPICI